MTPRRSGWALLLLVWLVALPVVAQATELVVWHSYRGNEEAALQQAADTWGAQAGVTVKTVAIPFGGFDSKVETAIPRGNGPDLFIAAHGSLGKWVTMGVVEPTELRGEGLTPGLMDAVSWEGRTFGLPLAYKSVVLLYNPALVDEPPATTDELIAMARELTGGGRYGLAYQAAEPYFHAPWAHAFGATVYDDQGQLLRLDSEAQQGAMAFSRRIAMDEGICPSQPTGELVGRLFNDGNAAFVISGPWFVADAEIPIAASVMPVVSETGEPARPYLTVDAAFLAAQATHPDEAQRFIAWLAGPEGARIRQDVGGQAVSDASTTTTDPFLQVMRQQADSAVLLPTDPDVANVWEAQARALRRVMRGASSPEAAVGEAQLYYDVVSRPLPPAANPWPYVALLGIVLGALAVWLLAPLRDRAFRARLLAHKGDYLWIAPAALALGLLVVVPFITGAGVSLFAHTKGEYTFIGLRHFFDIVLARDWPITSPLSFWFTLFITVLWTVVNLILHVGIGVALAMVLREPWIRLRGVWRALLILPWAVPNYITALIWKSMFHVQFGAINALITLAIGSPDPVEIDWFGSFFTSFGANVTTNAWLGFPFMMVITLGALQSIPRELEEAAEVDGAGWFFRFRHVIWPLLKPALLPAVILGSVWTFNMFNIIYLVSAGEPDGSTEILISEAYRWAFSRGNRYGYAAAYAVLIFGVLLVYSRAANRLAGRRVL